MGEQLSKTYDPYEVERQAHAVWQSKNLFHAEPTDPGPPYAIVIPPPNVTAALHLGHALNNTLQDILIRWRRMAGDNAVWLPGTDHAGIATQTVVEKRVLAEQGKRRTQFERNEFVKLIQAWKDEYEARITEQLKTMGCSCDWDRQAFTMDEVRARAVREAFFRLFKDGLIYRGKRLVNWDPATQTALADDEVEMEEIDGHFYYLKYPLEQSSPSPGTPGEGRGEGLSCVTVATTRPETMLGDTAVAINPKDPREAQLRGKHVRLPIVNRVVPIIEDDYVVLPDPESDDAKAKYATGFLKVTPAHDPNDYEIGQRHNLPLINVMAPDGSISDQHGWPKEDFDQGDAGFLLGLDRFEARKAVVEWFRQNNLLEDVKPYRHSVGHSYRSHVPIEPYLSDQWYCKVTDDRLAGAALRAMSPEQYEASSPQSGTGASPVHSSGATSSSDQNHSAEAHGRGAYATEKSPWQGQLKFFPARYAKTFQLWHENIRDWCISRQLWWGHRIPVWHIRRRQPGPILDVFINCGLNDAFYWPDGTEAPFICTRDPGADQVLRVLADVKEKKLEPAKAAEMLPWRSREIDTVGLVQTAAGFLEYLEQDLDVLDTWFSSGLWPLSTLGWPEETPELHKWNPSHTLCTAREIITLWVSRMVMFNLYFRDCLPFSEVFVHAMIQDGEGRKMSKSLGNGVDPLDIIESHGSDAMRFTLTLMTTNTQDVRMPVQRDEATGKNTSPKFDIGRNFCNKLWNASRFALTNLEQVPPAAIDESKWSIIDRWIMSRAARTVQQVHEALETYRFDAYAKACYDFFWRDLCDWYIEAIKPAMKDPQRAPQTSAVLATALDISLRLMHPMIPFITEVLWWRLNEVRPQRGFADATEPHLIKAQFPAFDEKVQALTSDGAEFVVGKLQELIGAIRTLRNEHKVDPKRSVKVSIRTPKDSGHQITANREMIELLAVCELGAVGEDLSPPANSSKTVAAGCEIFVEGLVDEAAEQQRIVKRREELTRQISAMKGRLANQGYIAKAPPHLVKQTQDQLAAAEAELAKLG